MAYDEGLAERIRETLLDTPPVVEKRMFGGLAFMVRGHMCCGIVGDDLMLRLGDDGAAEALAEPHTRPMDFTGKPMKSMLYVDAAGVAEDTALRGWVKRALRFNGTLEAK